MLWIALFQETGWGWRRRRCSKLFLLPKVFGMVCFCASIAVGRRGIWYYTTNIKIKYLVYVCLYNNEDLHLLRWSSFECSLDIPCIECLCWRGEAETGLCKWGDDIFRNPAAAFFKSLISFVKDEGPGVDWDNGLGVKAVISFSILLRRSSIRSMASWSPTPDAAAAAEAAVVLLVDNCDGKAMTERFLRSELLMHSIPLLAQKLHGLHPSHFVLRLRHVSQAEPELNRRAVLVVNTLRGWSDTTL